MKLFLDDDPKRDPKPDEGWTVVRTFSEAARKCKEIGLDKITEMSLDHDLGHGQFDGKHFANWLVDQFLKNGTETSTFHPELEIRVHSLNPVGAKNIAMFLSPFFDIYNVEFGSTIKVYIEEWRG